MKENIEHPDVIGMNQLEAGVLIHKYICILAMINFGTQEEKQLAKLRLSEIEQEVRLHVNDAAFLSAINRLGWENEEVELLNAV